jgi:hypothetical protein
MYYKGQRPYEKGNKKGIEEGVRGGGKANRKAEPFSDERLGKTECES